VERSNHGDGIRMGGGRDISDGVRVVGRRLPIQ